MQHDQPAVGEDFAEFVDPLHPQSLYVAIPVRRIDGIVSGHHRRIEGVNPADAVIGIGRELGEPTPQRVADGDDLGHAFPITIVAFDMADEVSDMVANLIVLT